MHCREVSNEVLTILNGLSDRRGEKKTALVLHPRSKQMSLAFNRASTSRSALDHLGPTYCQKPVEMTSTLSVDERLHLITRGLPETSGEDDIKALLENGLDPKGIWGT